MKAYIPETAITFFPATYWMLESSQDRQLEGAKCPTGHTKDFYEGWNFAGLPVYVVAIIGALIGGSLGIAVLSASQIAHAGIQIN